MAICVQFVLGEARQKLSRYKYCSIYVMKFESLQDLAQSYFASETKSICEVVNPETEIGRALLDCAINTHCNVDQPYASINSNFLLTRSIQFVDDLTVEVTSKYERSNYNIPGSGGFRLIHEQCLQETRDGCLTDMNLYQSRSHVLH